MDDNIEKKKMRDKTIKRNKIYYIVNNIVTHNITVNDAIDELYKIITDKIE